MRRTTGRRVRDLAEMAGMDLDEALVTLWDAGLDRFETGGETIHARELTAVERALGLTSAKEELRVEFWMQVSGLSREQLTTRLLEEQLTLRRDARRIPKNSLRRLRRMFNEGPRPIEQAPPPPPTPMPAFRWEMVGTPGPRRCLSADEILAIHGALAEDFADSQDPIFPAGVKSPHLLESAAARPETGYGPELKYPTVEMAASAMFHSIVHNHPFHNGNKRTALVSLAAMLYENNRMLTCSQQALFRFTLRTAQHRLVPVGSDQLSEREVFEIARWIRSESRAVDRSERLMKWHKLRQRLREFECVCVPASSGGNKMNITRELLIPRRIGPNRRRTLRTQVGYAGDGTEADRQTIRKIRHDLELDDDHGVDSTTFYRGSEVDQFIVEYRTILRRLAKL